MSNGIMANSILNAAAGMLLLVTGFVCSIITARLLGPEANGIIAFSLWMATTGALVAELGTGVLLLRTLPQLKAQGFTAARRRGFAAFLVTPTLVSTLTLVVLYAAIFLGSEEMHWAETAPSVALVTGILFIVQSIGAFAKNYLIGEQRIGDFLRLTAIASVVQLAVVLGGALLYGVEGALIGYACSQAVLFFYTLTIVFRARDRCDVPVDFLVSSSLLLSFQFIVESIFLNRLELLFIQQFWSVELVGFYAVGLSVANLALQLPVQLTGSLLPYYSEQRHGTTDGKLPMGVFAGVVRNLSYLTLPMAFGLAAVSGPLVTLVFGEAFRPSGHIVALLAIAAPPYVFVLVLTQYLFSVDRVRDRMLTGLVGAAVMVIGCLVLVPWYGGVGAAVARIVTFTVMCVLLIWKTGFGRSLGELNLTLFKVLIASLACGAVAYSIMEYAHSGVLGLLAAIFAGGITYGLGLRVFRAIPPTDAVVLNRIALKLPGNVGRLAQRCVSFIVPQFKAENHTDEAAGTSNATAEGVSAGRSAAYPVTFISTFGLFQPESEGATRRDCAVLFLSPWGFEEMCARKFYRIQAEHFADCGIPSLRFDYPGTGDALDLGPTDGLTVWEDSILAAASRLRAISGTDRLILVGQGLGATLAHRMAPRIGNVAGIAMLAPALNGRAYLREVAIWSKIVDLGLGLRDDQRDTTGVSIAGITMPEQIAQAVRTFNILAPTAIGSHQYLILERPVRASETSFGDELRSLGANVGFELFHGYDNLVSNPTIAVMPMGVVERVAAWAERISKPESSTQPSHAVISWEPLQSAEYTEIPVRFGVAGHLLGMMTIPVSPPAGSPVLILTTAYDRHAGWGRTTVAMARDLARRGITSLRYDPANVADSPPRENAPAQILYAESQGGDVSDALELLLSHSAGPALIVGRCSGGYQAFRSAIDDERLKAIVSVNPFVLFWDPEQSVEETLRFVPRSFGDYGQRMIKFTTITRLLSGQIDVRSAARNFTIAVLRRLSRMISPIIGRLSGHVSIGHEIRKAFEALNTRDVPVTLVYSDGDVGLEHMEFYFGPAGRRLKAYKNVKLIMLPDTDHNLTPPQSRQKVFDEVLSQARAGFCQPKAG